MHSEHPARLLALAVLAILSGAAAPLSANPLPVPCAPCTPGGAAVPWTAPGSASTYRVNGTAAVIRQAQDRETFNWSSFDIAPGHSVEFKQPRSSSIALNRILQNDPSRIFGSLKANGQIYLVNQNGILFKPGAQVDVNTLLASSLDLNPAVANLFEQVGITNVLQQSDGSNPAREPALVNTGADDPGAIVIEAGAVIEAQENGRVILVGGDVTNAGHIEASGPGGQVVLVAAKDKVYVFLPVNDPNLRGIAVELGEGGTVDNLGTIVTRQGNATLAGFAVNQRGVVRATSAVDVNGSIRLQARDRVGRTQQIGGAAGRRIAIPSRGGQVRLGPGSVTEVVLDADLARSAVDDQAGQPPVVDVLGAEILIEENARLAARGGELNLIARNKPDPTATSDAGSIRVAPGAVLDVSGARAVAVPMSRNVATLELRGNEFADAPVQRDGPLFGQRVRFDLRKPIPTIANLAAAVANVQRGAAERLAAGGEITLQAVARIDVAAGATLDVSGGSLLYEPGFIGTTRLLLQGRVVGISEADPRVRYDGVLDGLAYEHRKWGAATTERFFAFGTAMAEPLAGFEPGYAEGKDAGRVNIDTLVANIEGTLRAAILRGPYQRRPRGGTGGFARPYDEVPRGGQLVFDAVENPLLLTATGLPLVAEGFTEFSFEVARFVQPAGSALTLAPGGRLDVRALGEVLVDGTIRAQSGVVALASRVGQPDAGGLVALGANAAIDVSGGWVLDPLAPGRSEPAAPLFVDGGTVRLASNGDLRLATGSVVDVGGGAHRAAGATLAAGQGGRIELTAAVDRNVVTVAPDVVLDGELHGYVFAGASRGATLALSVPEIRLGSQTTPALPGTVTLLPSLFTDHGFTDFSLAANERGVTVAPGTTIEVYARQAVLGDPDGALFDAAMALPPTGADPATFTTAVRLPELDRLPTRISLEASPFALLGGVEFDPMATLLIGAGSRLAVEPGGGIALASRLPLVIAGELAAPAGRISARLETNQEAGFGYDAGRAIWLTAASALDVSGVVLSGVVDDLARSPETRVLDAGSIELVANEGYVVGLPGSRLLVGGARGLVDVRVSDGLALPRFAQLPLASNAGEVAVRASNGIQLWSAPRGESAGLGTRGGTLELALDGNLRRANQSFGAAVDLRFPERPLRLQLGTSRPPPALAALAPVDDALFGIGRFDLAAFAASGFDALRLSATPQETQRAPNTGGPDPLMEAQVELTGNFTLDLPRSLVIDAPILRSDGGAATLAAGRLALGFSNSRFVATDTPLPDSTTDPTVKHFSAQGGAGRVRLAGETIDLVGFLALRGFGGAGEGAPVQLASAGDLRLRGVRSPEDVSRALQGTLAVAADLALTAARIYPTTLSEFRIVNEAGGGTIAITGGGNEALPLSAAGTVRVEADRILHHGTLMAPMGAITLDANSLLELGPTSLTSVTAAGGTLLFGRTEIGDWVFPFGGPDQVTRVFDAAAQAAISALPPEKRIVLRADGVAAGAPLGHVDLQHGARLDVRRGGDLVATEFLPGPRGSIDLLDSARQAGSFAVLPPINAGLAAYDPLDSPDFEYAPGTRFRVSNGGASGLAGGAYVVLPPRYALLPGALLLTPVAAAESAAPVSRSLALADGLPIVLGSFVEDGVAGAPRVNRLRFQVESSAAVRGRAEYRESLANGFFAAQAAAAGVAVPLLPRDAGAVTIAANAGLALGATLVVDRAVDGRGSRVDLSAEDIVIRARPTGAAGAVELAADGLARLGAESLLVGGTRTVAGDVTTIADIAADTVTVEPGLALSLPELILVAGDRVEVGDGARLRGTGAGNPRQRTFAIEGDAALAAVTANPLPAVRHAGVPASPTAVAQVGRDAELSGTGGVIVDSTGDTVLNGRIATGGGLHLGARRIGLGAAPAGTPGLVLDAARLATLGAAELVLASAGTLDLHGDLDATFQTLEIDAAGLRGAPDVGRVTLRANALRLHNSGAGRLDASPRGSGTLQLVAESVLLGEASSSGAGDTADFDFVGFDAVGLTADRVLATADHDLAVAAAGLTITSDLLAASRGTALTITASGAVTTGLRGGTILTAAERAALVGGAVALSGASVTHGGHIVAPSGSVTLTAGTGDLGVLAGASIDTSGLSALDFEFFTLGTPGGTVRLRADAGNLDLADGATVEVSAGSGLASVSGGTLELTAPAGSLTVGAATQLRGTAPLAQSGAQVRVDARDLAGSGQIGPLNALLNGGGFAGERNLRLRGAGIDLTVAADDVVRARYIRLAADQGAVTIGGRLDAGGLVPGAIDLFAADTLTIAPGAALLARVSGGLPAPAATAAAPTYADGLRGGKVNLTAPTGTLVLGGGTIDVAGTVATAGGGLAAAANGRVSLTAARLGAADVAIAPIATTIVGAEDLVVIGHRQYAPGAAGGIVDEAATFTAGAAALLADLDLDGMTIARAAPGVEIRFAGDLGLAGLAPDLDGLFDASAIGAGVLTVRSGGALTVDTDLRDGVISESFFDGSTVQLADSARSWSFQLVGGADLDAVDPTAVIAGGAGIAVTAGTDVVTGTGDITLAAGGDLDLAAGATVQAIGRHLDPVAVAGTILDDRTGDPFIDTFISPTAYLKFLKGVSFPEAGGDITLTAGRDLRGVHGGQQVHDWVYRIGGEALGALGDAPTAWGLALDAFANNLASFGGGRLAATAGRTIQGLSFSQASFGKQIGDNVYDKFSAVWATTRDVVDEIGGGELALDAGADILGAELHLARGWGTVRAGGRVDQLGAARPRVLLGAAQLQIEASGEIDLGTVADPNGLRLSPTNPVNDIAPTQPFHTLYSSYTSQSALTLMSAAADVILRNQAASSSGLAVAIPELANFYPGTLSLLAPGGDVAIDGFMSLAPTAQGTLTVAAGANLRRLGGVAPQILQSDAAPALFFEPRAHPAIGGSLPDLQAAFQYVLPDVAHALAPVHAADRTPNRLVALTGDIFEVSLALTKTSNFHAGRDLSNLDVLVQNIADTDISSFTAGRDIAMAAVRVEDVGRVLSSNQAYTLAGPGEFQFESGEDIDLGTSAGIRAVGDNLNRALADQGGDVSLLAGLSSPPAWAAFIARYLVPGAGYDAELAGFLAELGASGRYTFDAALDAVARFESLPRPAQQRFLLEVLYGELQASGVAASDPASSEFRNYARGFDAIATLFPAGRQRGDLTTPLSTVQTQDGGTIRLAVPGGLVDAGLTASAGLGGFKEDTELGYIVFRRGAIKALVQDAFNVNSTRVFAQQGGDVLVWSSTGDIDAGRGAKTAASIPVTAAIFDEFGNYVNEPPLAVSGSGIRNFAPPGTPPGTLFLFAPQGVINAGDAGIGSAGNIVLGATEVIGADNIDIGGVGIGVPTADTGGIAAGLTGVGDVAASATKATERAAAEAAAQAAAAQADNAFAQPELTIITVQVLGFGS